MKNQLQFTLNAPPSAANLAVRHQILDPIVVEKVGASDGHRVMPPLAVNAGRNFQFQALSKDKMEMAVLLAKRDLKMKKTAKEIGQRSRSPSPLGRRGTKVVKSREYKNRLKQQELKKKTNVLKIKEKVGRGNWVNTSKQIKPAVSRDRNASPVPTSHLPATTSSPPTRDNNLRRALTKDEQQTSEIHRIQDEIQQFLVNIQNLVQRIVDGDMLQDGAVKLRGQDDLHLGEEEGEVRRRLRCEEQTTRSARMVYFLKQQIRGIQEDFSRLGPDKIWRVKKSQTLTRLASAHRGAVRSLQTLVSQLQNQLPREGPPSGCKELTPLLKELTSLSSQIGDDVHTDTNDRQTDAQTTVTLLGHIEDLCSVWEEESRIIRASQKSPERAPSMSRPPQRGRTREGRQGRGVLKKHPRNVQVKFRPQLKGRQPAKSTSPERRAALRAGLAAILREDNSSGPPKPTFAQEEPRNVRFIPEYIPATKKGLLLPQQLQHPRPVTSGVTSGHFADPTMSSNMKAVSPQRNPVTQPRSSSAPSSPRGRSRPESPGEPHWALPDTPNQVPKGRSPRSRSHSPRCVTCASLTTSMEDLSVDLFDEERRQKLQKGHVHFAKPRSRSPSPSYRRHSPKRYREDDIVRRLEPLYSQSELLAKKQEAAMKSNLERRRNFQLDSDIDQQTRAEVLSELVFNDLLTDTVGEFQTLQGENSAAEEAARLINNPSLEVMVQRLEQMELEQEQIRRRWTSVRFESEELRRCAGAMETPSDPGPVDMTSLYGGGTQKSALRATETPDLGAILFTKFKKPFDNRGRQLLSTSNKGSADVVPRVPIKLSDEVVTEIHENVEKYEQYLKRTCHHVAGKFDPWQLVKEVSDEIIEDCLTEVAGELEDMSSDIVNHLYSSEFAMATQDPPSPPTTEMGL